MGEIEELLVMERSECILASAKNGVGIEEIVEAIVHRIPPPKGHRDHLRALVFNAQFDPYRGVVSYVRVVDGKLVGGNAIHVDGARTRLRMHRGGHLRAGDAGDAVAGVRRRGLRHRQHQVAGRDRRRRHDHVGATNPAHVALAGLPQSGADGVLRPLSQRRRVRRPARRAGEAQAQRRGAASTSPRARWRWASASAAASWACCTWRSCKSGWSATTTST